MDHALLPVFRPVTAGGGTVKPGITACVPAGRIILAMSIKYSTDPEDTDAARCGAQVRLLIDGLGSPFFTQCGMREVEDKMRRG